MVEYPVKSIDDENYRIDLYYPSIKLAIEVLEAFHLKQSDKDKEREEKIKEVLDCDFEYIKIYEKDFLHVNTIASLKKKIISRFKKTSSAIGWNPVIFNVDDALEDHEGLIFVKDRGVSFPSFQLAKEFHKREDLIVAIVKNSTSKFGESGLKVITNIYSVENISPEKNGYIKWWGEELENHPLQISGETVINMTTSSYSNLVLNNDRKKVARSRYTRKKKKR